MQTDVSLRVEDTGATDAFRVSGRGELHLSILIETMRRQGYEFAVTKPMVLYKNIGGELHEPMEKVVCDVPAEYVGAVIDKISRRHATCCPCRATTACAWNSPFPPGACSATAPSLTDTRGEGIMNAIFDGYEPVKGDIPTRVCGSLVASETGETTSYALFNLQDRELFIEPGEKVYNGMIIGQSLPPRRYRCERVQEKAHDQQPQQRLRRRGPEDHQREGAHPGGGPGIHR